MFNRIRNWIDTVLMRRFRKIEIQALCLVDQIPKQAKYALYRRWMRNDHGFRRMVMAEVDEGGAQFDLDFILMLIHNHMNDDQ